MHGFYALTNKEMEKEDLIYKEKKTPFTRVNLSSQDLYSLAEKVGTPYYLIDERVMAENYYRLLNAYRGYIGSVSVAYSVKANFNPYVLGTYAKLGTKFDVTSPEELYFLLKSGGAPENVIYTSVTEGKEEYAEVLSKGVRRVVVSSQNGLNNLIEAASALNVVPTVGIRVNPEVQVKAEVKSSFKISKFGVPFNGGAPESAYKLTKQILGSDKVTFGGVHFHLGSQVETPAAYIMALEKVKNFIMRIKKELGAGLLFLDIGGGTPVNYGIKVPTPEEMASQIVDKLNDIAMINGSPYNLIIESGRYLVAESTILVSKIVNVKYYNSKKIIYLDTGYHQLLDIALLQQIYPLEVVPSDESEAAEKPLVAGRLCDSMDVFQIGPESKLEGADIGKLMVIKNVGAYSIVFNMPFHSQVKPAVVFRDSKGNYYLARKRQDLEELYDEEGGSLYAKKEAIA